MHNDCGANLPDFLTRTCEQPSGFFRDIGDYKVPSGLILQNE